MSLCTDRGQKVLEGSPITRVRQHLQASRGGTPQRLGSTTVADLAALEVRLRRVQQLVAGVEFSPDMLQLMAARSRNGAADGSRVLEPEGV